MTETSDRALQFSRRKAIVALIAGGFVALVIAEILVRIVLPHPAHFLGHPANVPGLVTQHDVRGYTWAPGFEGKMTSDEFSNRYVISSQGFRDEFIEKNGARRILALGDSFTGGEGVEADETWPKQLEILLNGEEHTGAGTRVINAGVTGYSARQMRQMAEEVVPVFEPKHVIIGLFTHGYDRVEDPFALVGVHLVRQREVQNMRLLDNGYIWWHQTEFESPAAVSFEIWCQNYWHFGAYVIRLIHRLRQIGGDSSASISGALPAATRLEPVFRELLLLDRFLDSHNSSLTVLVISGQSSDGTFSTDNKALASTIRAFGEANGIRVVDPIAALEAQAKGEPIFRFKKDGHWTPPAHRVVAEVIVKSLQRVK